MNDDDRVDLSALKLTHSEFESFLDSTLARADDNLRMRRRQGDLALIVTGWRREILAAAAILIAILIPVEIALELREQPGQRIATLAQASADAARGLRQLSPTDLLKAVVWERQR